MMSISNNTKMYKENGDVKMRLERQKNVLEKQHKYFSSRPSKHSQDNYTKAVRNQIVDIDKRIASQDEVSTKQSESKQEISMAERRQQRFSLPEYGRKLDMYV